ncbi:hypothetical protein [Reyranella sp. CPCC 100927]|uniref:hypothetical protein n=1 Tax=Reyranella sp. CPCC 100927 TaxID=2599616 RepID=UPI0011B847E2|nr:hypothetical protein [Reyranella sp. CPCC 100927]TWT02916.1 hypothetical protein FQU96_29935 [Reyranella sp. CPCC 100927]
MEQRSTRPRYRGRILGLALVVVLAGGAAAWYGWRTQGGPAELPCPTPQADRGTAHCLTAVTLPGAKLPVTATIGLSADGTIAFVQLDADRNKPVALRGISTQDGRELWRLPIPMSTEAQGVVFAPSSKQVAVWDKGRSVRVMSVPDGKVLSDVTTETFSAFDVSFSPEGDAIVAHHRRYKLSDPAASPSSEPGFRADGRCNIVVGQSNIDAVLSRDRSLVVKMTTSGRFSRGTDFCEAKTVLILDGPEMGFLSFAPGDRRLAVAYNIAGRSRSDWRTLVEIYDTEGRSGSAARLSRIVLDGDVGYRLGWSPDGTQLAVIKIKDQIATAQVYAVP